MDNENFEKFLLAEYDHIADAHFESGKQIAKFFNYYLLILAAPVILVSLVQNKHLDSIISPAKDGEALFIHWLIIFLFSIISLVGFALCWIVIELQHDSILYARTVNGIRNYFYKQNQTQIDEKTIRVLPRNVYQPDFFSYGHLGVIVGTFAVVNSSFLGASLYILMRGNWCGIEILIFCFFLLHFLIHFLLSKRRSQKHKPHPEDAHDA